MNKLRHAFLIVILLVVVFNLFGQQKPAYDQYMFNTFLINPAAAGSEGYTAFNFTGHEQWLGLPNAPATNSVSVQTRILKNSFIAKALNLRKKFSKRSSSGRVGVGAYVYNDSNGPISNTGLQLTYAYHIPLRQNQLSFGLSASTYQFKINKSNLNLNDPSDPFVIKNSLSKFTFDGNFGVQYTTPRIYSGLSVSDLFQSNLSFGNNPSQDLHYIRQYSLMGGYKVELTRDFMLEPSTLIKFTEKGAFQMDITAKVNYREDYWAGLTYRNGAYGGSVIFLAGVRVNKYYFGYAFEYSLAPIMAYTLGSHELMFSIKFGETARRYRWLNRY